VKANGLADAARGISEADAESIQSYEQRMPVFNLGIIVVALITLTILIELHLRSQSQTQRTAFCLVGGRSSAAPDVMFDPSEVREILGLVLEQVRSGAEEEINDDAGFGEADNDDESEDERARH
jgi:hypothetical protein